MMRQRLALLIAGVAVLACAIPATASASEVTLPAGTRAPVGIEFTATGKDIIQKSNFLGNLTCSTLNLNAKLNLNNGTTFEASGSNVAPTQSGCLNGTKTINITEFNITKLISSTSGSGTMSFVAKEDIGELQCTYTGTNVPFSYTKGTSVIKFNEGGGITGSPSSCGTLKLSGEFSLEKRGTTTALILD